MVFAPVDPSIKEKVVAAYLAGKGRNQIDREFREKGIKVSHGSISNVINAYNKRKHEQPPQQDVSTDADIDNTSSPSSMVQKGPAFGIAQAISGVNNKSSEVINAPRYSATEECHKRRRNWECVSGKRSSWPPNLLWLDLARRCAKLINGQCIHAQNQESYK
jgi:hypothetical protein